MSALEPIFARTLDDGTDRASWLAARRLAVIGASDAAKLAKLTSLDSYLAAKLAPSSFHGNDYTVSGHRWEPMMLAWAGIAGNTRLIHSPSERGFAATPDGIDIVDGRVVLAECKAKHNKVVAGPSLGEWRQLAWQFVAIPEAEYCEFIWAEIVNDEMRTDEPKHLTVPRDHPKIREVTAAIMPIAVPLLAMLRVALEAEKELFAS
jgi:hypothetical protein